MCVAHVSNHDAEPFSLTSAAPCRPEEQITTENPPTMPCHFQEPDPEQFNRWFPGLRLSRTACENPRSGINSTALPSIIT